MEEVVIKAKPRAVKGKQVKVMRRTGELPAVLYGRSLDHPISVTLNMREASRVLPTITSSHLVIIDVDGERYPALVKERQRHPVHSGLLHVDFLVVSMTEKLRTNVVIVLEGDSPAVKNFNGVVMLNLEKIEVECLPGDMPERMVVNISNLRNIGDAVYVRDLKLPDTVEVLTNLDETVVVVTAQAGEEGAAVSLEGAFEPEVIEKGKKEDEDF